MTRVSRAAVALIVGAGAFAAFGLAQPQDKGAQPQMTPEQMKKMQETMKAYKDAGKLGKQHEFLKKGVGTWDGKVKSYEMPGQPPEESACVEHVTSVLQGHFTKCEVSGEMGQMGHFEGLGLYGYDNAKQKYTMAWADNMGTCIMDGTGVLSDDEKTLTWTMNYVNPATHKPETMREVDHYIDADQIQMEMFGQNPMTGKEMKMIEISLSRRGGDQGAGAGSAPGK